MAHDRSEHGEGGTSKKNGKGKASTRTLPPPGGEITEIRPLKRDPNLRAIFVGRTRVATVTATAVETLKLRARQPWTAETAANIESEQRRAGIHRAALRLLGSRGYSRAELQTVLTRRNHNETEVAAVLNDLQQQGWIDDKAVAQSVAEGATRKDPAGKALLRERIKRKGVAEDVAEDVAESAAASIDDVRALVRKRLAKMTELKPAVRLRRLSGALSRRGIAEDVAEEVLREFAQEIGVEPGE